MGQQSLILAMLAILTTGIVVYNMQAATARGEAAQHAYHATEFSREIARAGHQQTVHSLVNAVEAWDATDAFDIDRTPYGSGAYRVRVYDYQGGSTPADPALPVLDDQVTVESIGYFRDQRTGQDQAYTIRAVYTKRTEDVGIPPATRYALVAGGSSLSLRGNATVRSGLDGQPANVHANGDLDIQGSSRNIEIHGQGTYADAYSGSRTDYFQPPDADAASAVFQTDAVPIPPVDFSDPDLRSQATEVIDGNVRLNGRRTINLEATGWDANGDGYAQTGTGTADDPFVLYVDGNLNLKGDLRLHRNGTNAAGERQQAHVVVYVTGNAAIQGNGRITPTERVVPSARTSETATRSWIADTLPEGVSLSMYVGGNVSINSNSRVAGRIQANGAVTYSGGRNANLIGGLAARGDMRLSGHASLYAVSATESVVPESVQYEVPTGVELLAYAEWVGEGAGTGDGRNDDRDDDDRDDDDRDDDDRDDDDRDDDDRDDDDRDDDDRGNGNSGNGNSGNGNSGNGNSGNGNSGNGNSGNGNSGNGDRGDDGSTCATSWFAPTVYVAGDVVSHDGSEWQARWWTRGQPPSNRRWGPWKRLGRCTEEAASRGTCTTSWNTSTVYRAGDVVSHDGSEWQARWWTRGQPPANRPSGPWDQLGRCTP
jgi:hypothetical protein